jgi:hypothetical protein
MIVPPIAYKRSIVREKGRNMPTIPVIPAVTRRPVSGDGRMKEIKKTLAESDEAAE